MMNARQDRGLNEQTYSSLRTSQEKQNDMKVRLRKFIFDEWMLYCHEITDVVKQIKLIIEHYGARLVIEERNLLSVAYKHITNTLRNSWRIANTLLKWQVERSLQRTNHLLLIRRECETIERELSKVCKDIVSLLDQQLFPAAEKGEEQVFYSKM